MKTRHMDFFNRKKIRKLNAELVVARNNAEDWMNKYQNVVLACLRNDTQIREYLEFIYKDKYFKFELFDPEKNEAVLHKMKIDNVSYNGGIITFDVHEGEKITQHRIRFSCLHHFKQISKKTYLS